jgi:hypothetical protein
MNFLVTLSVNGMKKISWLFATFFGSDVNEKRLPDPVEESLQLQIPHELSVRHLQHHSIISEFSFYLLEHRTSQQKKKAYVILFL